MGASQELEALFVPGEVCIFTYAEWLKAYYEEWTAHLGRDSSSPSESVSEAVMISEQLRECAISSTEQIHETGPKVGASMQL